MPGLLAGTQVWVCASLSQEQRVAEGIMQGVWVRQWTWDRVAGEGWGRPSGLIRPSAGLSG